MKEFRFLLPGLVVFVSSIVAGIAIAVAYPTSPEMRMVGAMVAFVGMWVAIAINQRERRAR